MTRRAWTDYTSVRHIQPPLIAPEPLAEAQPKRRRPGSVRKIDPREVDIQKIIFDALVLHPSVGRIERCNTGAGRLMRKDGTTGRFVRFGSKGQGDLEGWLNDGRKLLIEVKRPSTRNHVSGDQQDRIDCVRSCGGVAGVATSVEEAFAIVEGR